nr:probable palmitoyltransferase ZDHHC11 [Macaca nemestrina]
MSGAPVRPAHLLQGALLCDHGSLKVKKPHLPEAGHRWELSRPAGRGVCDSEEAPGAVCSAWALTPRDPRADPRRPLTPGCSRKVPPWKLSAPLTSHQTCWLLNLGLPASRTGRNKFLFFKITASQMDTRSGSQCSVAPEAVLNNGDLVLPPRISRVNGWSLPLHYFQVVTWAVFLGLSSATFGIFIPLLPHVWKYIAYVVTGGIFFFHLVVHLIASCIDPADFNVRLMKNYSQPMPIFDRSKHAHVIQNQFCHLCKVTVNKKTKHCISCNKCVSGFDHHCKWINNCVGSRNYWFFFSTVASATAGMLCLITILLYILVQYFVDPGVLRTDPNYEDVKNTNTWLLFLPLFPVQVQTLIVVIIGMVVLLLDLLGLVQLGQLLIFHIYLRSACPRNEIMGKKGKSQEEIKAMRAQQAQQGAKLTQRPAGAVPGADTTYCFAPAFGTKLRGAADGYTVYLSFLKVSDPHVTATLALDVAPLVLWKPVLLAFGEAWPTHRLLPEGCEVPEDEPLPSGGISHLFLSPAVLAPGAREGPPEESCQGGDLHTAGRCGHEPTQLAQGLCGVEEASAEQLMGPSPSAGPRPRFSCYEFSFTPQQGDGALGSSAQGDKAKNSLLTFKCLYHHSTPLPSDKSSSEQEADDEPSPSSLRAKVKSFLLIYKSPCHFCTSVNPDGDSSAKEADVVRSLSSLGVNARDSLQIYRRPSPFSSTVHPEGGSTAQEADDEPSLSSLGVNARDSLQIYRRPSPFCSTVHPEGGSTARVSCSHECCTPRTGPCGECVV